MTKENQINELRDLIMIGSRLDVNSATAFAETLYQRGYRKQSEGEWIYGEYYIAHCSECGREVPDHLISPFCPNCGARMEDGAE